MAGTVGGGAVCHEGLISGRYEGVGNDGIPKARPGIRFALYSNEAFVMIWFAELGKGCWCDPI